MTCPSCEDDDLINPAPQVYFRAGLIACREYMARFVESQSPEIAASIRANWWPELGPDLGPPRKLEFNEIADVQEKDGELWFVGRGADEVTPTLEALPIAHGFLALTDEESTT